MNLLNNGLIDEENSTEDKRYKLYYPLVSFDIDSNGNGNGNDYDEKMRKYMNQNQFLNFLHYSPILLPKNYRQVPENWLIMEILAFLKCGIQLEDIVLHDKNGVKQSIKEFTSEYEKDVSLIPYFKRANSSNSHNKIFEDIIDLGNNWNKGVEKCGIDSNSSNSAFSEDTFTEEKPEKCPKCGRMVEPFDKNIHPACWSGV